MIEVVCAVIEDAEGRVLACKRPQHKHLGGLWEFHGGKLEEGEGHAAAIVREIREELGIEVEVHGELSAVVWHYPEVSIRLHPQRCRILQGKPQTLEHEELRWVTRADAGNLPWAEADVPILHELWVVSSNSTAG